MKRWRLLLVVVLFLALLMPSSVLAGIITLEAAQLTALKHNAPLTGIMLPSEFSPFQDHYLLTVANWVSRITLTPVAASPHAQIMIRGEVVPSGSPSPVIRLDDEPTLVQIGVTAFDEAGNHLGYAEYSVFIQRRPSERRTRVSAGYIAEISLINGVATVAADLVTLSYQQNSNISSFVNDMVYLYRYSCAPNCLFYYGEPDNPVRARTAQEFIDNYLNTGNSLYYLTYIEDQIVSVMPYGPD